MAGGRQVDDRQPRMSEARLAIGPDSFVVWPAVPKRCYHLSQPRLGHFPRQPRTRKEKPSNAAHSRWSSETLVQSEEKFRLAGFTLVEVLVTLVLLTLAVSVALGSLRQVLDTRSRLRPYLDQSEQTALVAGWFRQTVQALIADYETGKDRFVGTPDRISGLTGSPLVGPSGTPTPFSWLLSYEADGDLTVFGYRERPAAVIEIARWPGHDAVFSYYDQNQQWQRTWPPAGSDESRRAVQLPLLIRLGGLAPDLFPTIVAAPRASSVPRPLPPSFLSGAATQN
jgi:prepilin-type N-terminal cleavage/methylation domain-containing protein